MASASWYCSAGRWSNPQSDCAENEKSNALVASQAAVGGPSTALALAAGLDRDDLAVAGIALGLLGYVIGTYLGVAVAAWVV